MEVNLSSLGIGGRDAGERRAEFYLENMMTGNHILRIVQRYHSECYCKGSVRGPGDSLQAKARMAHYKKAFELETAGVQPLVFDIFENYAKGTFESSPAW